MRKKTCRTNIMISGLTVLIIIFLGLMINNAENIFGISENNLVKEACESGKVDKNWKTLFATSDTSAILCFYSPDLEQSRYQVYARKETSLGGYRFERGGTRPYMNDYIVSIEFEDSGEIAYVSLNKQQIEKIEMKTADGTRIMDISSDEPFAIIVDKCITVVFRDVEGKEVASIPENTWTIQNDKW